MRTQTTHNDRGIALIMVMLLTVAVAAMAAGAIFLTSSATLVARGQEREEEMRNAADAGIEYGRSTLNGGSVVLDTIYHALVTNQSVLDANGNVISGITRSVYYGPTGSSTGQYGIFASIVSIITDQSGAVVVRRGELAQESFAKFAYYTDDEGSGICFGSSDNIFGPLHTNDNMCIYSPIGAHFFSEVEVAGTITGKAYGIFDVSPPIERGAVIPLPTLAQLTRLNTYATQGGMSFTTTSSGGSSEARMRIEFLALDLDNDGRVSGPDEGFFKIYRDTVTGNEDYVMATRIARPDTSRNCGHYHTVPVSSGGTRQVFETAFDHQNNSGLANITGHTGGSANEGTTAANESLSNGTYRCYLGGSEQLFIDSNLVAPKDYRNTFRVTDRYGQWQRYTATPDARVIAALKNAASAAADTTLVNRTLYAGYLFPLSRAFNPNTKGVIYVSGRVALSGVINARLTVASNDNVIIADDLRYSITPGSAPCLGANILGLLSPDTIFLANNAINAPWDYTQGASDGGSTYRSYDESDAETLQGVILTLTSFYNESHGSGSNSAQPCQGTNWGRGCLFLTGGIIQATRGAVGTSSGTGTLKRYAYDVCAFQTPPPYFPTTGRYLRNRYYEIDPVGFNVANFYASLTPTN